MSTTKKRTEGGTLGGGAPLEERLGMLNVTAAPREGTGIREIKPQKSKKQPVGIVEIGDDGAFELPDDEPEELEEEEDEFDDNSEVPSSTSTSGPASAAAVPLADAIAEALNDDDEPPALDDDEPPMPSPVNPAAAAAVDEGPSLMDEMMAAGMAVHEEKKKKKAEEEKRVKKDFGNGLKGGFFNSSKPKAKKAGGGKAKGGAVKKGFLDSKPSKGKKAAKPKSQTAEGPQRIETLRPAPKDPSAKTKDPLRFDEVQEAMAASVGPMEKELGKGEWMTPDLMQTLASNPRLAAGMQNPYYMAAMAELQKDPKKAMEKIQKQADPGLKSFLEEFCGVMGQHFTSLGMQQQQQQQQQQQAKQPNITPVGPASTPSQPAASMDTPQGPLAEAAMKKYMENARKAQEAGTAAPPMPTPNAEEDAKVDLVMRNQELRELLMDREMQEVMQKCGHPGALQYYMTDPTWGPKLRKLAEAGLVRIER